MKRYFLAFLFIICIFLLSSCFLSGGTTYYPDMIEYSEEEVLEVAKDKYHVEEWVFIGIFFRGSVKNIDSQLSVTSESENIGESFINGDNIYAALTSFAGKNGNHDVQGTYTNFLSYVALARCDGGSLKYIYYNTNINKNESIFDTIGSSDYNFDTSPLDIDDSLFETDSYLGDLSSFLTGFKGINPRDFTYSRDRLTYITAEQLGGSNEIEFYRENGSVVYDIYHDKGPYDGKNRELIYSSSDRYGLIYSHNGADFSKYFSVSTSIEHSTEENGTMVMWGSIEALPITGSVIYSKITFSAEYPTISDGKAAITESSDAVVNDLDVTRGYGMANSEEIDFESTAKFSLTSYYILYLKENIGD